MASHVAACMHRSTPQTDFDEQLAVLGATFQTVASRFTGIVDRVQRLEQVTLITPGSD